MSYILFNIFNIKYLLNYHKSKLFRTLFIEHSCTFISFWNLNLLRGSKKLASYCKNHGTALKFLFNDQLKCRTSENFILQKIIAYKSERNRETVFIVCYFFLFLTSSYLSKKVVQECFWHTWTISGIFF